MSVGFRPSPEDNEIIQAHKRPDESTSDVLRRALRALDRERWDSQAREDMERIAASGEDLSDEPDEWGYDEDGAPADLRGRSTPTSDENVKAGAETWYGMSSYQSALKSIRSTAGPLRTALSVPALESTEIADFLRSVAGMTSPEMDRLLAYRGSFLPALFTSYSCTLDTDDTESTEKPDAPVLATPFVAVLVPEASDRQPAGEQSRSRSHKRLIAARAAARRAHKR
ncbi:hypothetical protein ACF08B_38835 [Streptomyces sp. NPDC015139]|uniref:hypothetical protein n=1 Tax=Streptomyces sp. NPDC015139 TaxID=3364942 RepID=UPI0036FA2956